MRPALTVLAAGTIAAAALLAPSAASADTHVSWPPAGPHRAQSRIVDPDNDITWTVVDHKITLTSPDVVVVPIQYTCGTAAAPQDRQYAPGVFQATLDDATAAAFEVPQDENTPVVGVTFTCDGVQHVVDVSPGRAPAGPGDGSADKGFERGNIEVGLFDVATDAPARFEHAIVGDAPADTRAPVTVTVNATPESTRPGKKITVKGTLERDGHAYKDKFAILYFQDTDAGKPAQRVGDDHSSSKGNLETKVKVTGPGTYFWVTRSTSKTQAGATLGDYAAAGTHRIS